MVQAVAKFVKQGGDVVMAQEGGLAANACGKVAHQLRHWRLQRARVGAQPAAAYIVHPRATAFACAGGSDDTRSYIINAIPVAGAAMENDRCKGYRLLNTSESGAVADDGDTGFDTSVDASCWKR